MVYFKLDLDGQLNECQERKAIGSTVLTLSVGEVPEGRWRTLYLVRVISTIAPLSLIDRPLAVFSRCGNVIEDTNVYLYNYLDSHVKVNISAS